MKEKKTVNEVLNEEKKHAKAKVTLALSVICSLILIGLFVSYAYFQLAKVNVEEKFSLQTGTMILVFNDGDNGVDEELNLGESVVKKFNIENKGTLTSALSINWVDLINTYINGSLTYTLSYSEELDGTYKEIVPKTNVPSSNTKLTQPLAAELSVPAGDTYYYNLEITLNNLKDVIQNDDIDAKLTTKFNVTNPKKYINYKLTVNPGGGTWETFTAPQEYLMNNNETLDIPNPTRTGYTFDGWTLSGTSSTLSGTTFMMGLENATLVANWTPNKYTVTIDDGSGSTHDEEADFGSTVTLPSNPTKEGFTFTGWNITGGTLEENTLTITDPSNITVTPNFVVNKYKYIVYHNKMNIGGEGYTLVEGDTFEEEADYNTKVTPSTKTYTGFTSPANKDLTIQVENTYPPVLNKVEYNYTRNKHNLTLELNGSTSSISNKEMYYEETLNLGTPLKTGYNFTNWTSTSGNLENNTFQMGDSDSTVTANFTPKSFSITFNPNGGVVETGSKIVNYDDAYGELPTPTYEGYEFKGWFTEVDGGTEVKSETKVDLSDNQTLYAKWEENTPKTGTDTLLAKANADNIYSYSGGNTGEMFAFKQPSTSQLQATTDYRYIGKNPNNYVTFNGETWRIIGVFPTSNMSGISEMRIKLIANQSIGSKNWDDNGTGNWANSSLQSYLNSTYYYRLSDDAVKQIDYAKWYLGGISQYRNLSAEDYYKAERGTTVYSGFNQYILKYIGLMYASDYIYTYANGVNSTCFSDNYNCKNGSPSAGWLWANNKEWLQTCVASGMYYASIIYSNGGVNEENSVKVTDNAREVRPSVYLKADVKITGGNGTSTSPYTLSVP